jgi:hypothetical protein
MNINRHTSKPIAAMGVWRLLINSVYDASLNILHLPSASETASTVGGLDTASLSGCGGSEGKSKSGQVVYKVFQLGNH